MKNKYVVYAWCQRPFIACLDMEAETPQQALADARRQCAQLIELAYACDDRYPWDEFAVEDENGREVLAVLDEHARLRVEAPRLFGALIHLRAALRLSQFAKASDEQVDEALKVAEEVIANLRAA